jgi:hypothetical protein
MEIVKNLEDLTLKWLHRARNRLYLRENKIGIRWIENLCG